MVDFPNLREVDRRERLRPSVELVPIEGHHLQLGGVEGGVDRRFDVGVHTRADAAHDRCGDLGRLEARFEQLHPTCESIHRRRHRPDGVEAGRQRPDTLERDAAMCGFESGCATARRGDADGAARVGADRHVGLVSRDSDGRTAGRPTWDEV